MKEASLDYALVDDIYYSKHKVSCADIYPNLFKRLETASDPLDDMWLIDGFYIGVEVNGKYLITHCKMIRLEGERGNQIVLEESRDDECITLKSFMGELERIKSQN